MFKKSLLRSLALALILLLTLGCSATALAASSTLTISAPDEWSIHSWDDSLSVKWNAVTGAAGYYVTIKNETDDSYIVQNKWTTSRSYSTSALPSSVAELKIWVGAVDSSSKAGAEAFAADTIYVYVGHEPALTNGASSSVTESGARLQMSVDKDNGYPITDCGFYIGTSSTKSKMTKYSFWDYSTSYGADSKGTKYMTVTGLEPGTTYYYRAYAENDVGEDWTSAKSFTTERGRLDDPVITSPADGDARIHNQSIALKWNPVAGADGYRYHIKRLSGAPDRSNSNEPYVQSWEGIASSISYTFGASKVVGGYWYKFVIEAYADGMDSSWSNWVYVWVEKGDLSRAVVVSPEDMATLSGGQAIRFDWNAVSGAQGYDYYIKRLSGAPDRTNENEPFVAQWNGSTDSGTTEYTLAAENVVAGYWYKFVVQAHAEGMNPSWSVWRYAYVDVGNLSKPNVVSPRDTATYSGNRAILFDWDAVPGAQGYRYYIKRLSGMPDRTNDNEPFAAQWNGSTASGTTQYTLAASNVLPGYWYKFVVEAYADGMNPSWSIWTYCYVDSVRLKDAVITSPSNWSEAKPGEGIDVNWKSVSGADGYRCHIKQLSGEPDSSNDNEASVNTWRVDCGSASEYTLQASRVAEGYWYKFVVEAYASGATSSWSDWIYVYAPERGVLEKPVIISPAAGQDCEAGSDIRFTWMKVDGAESYTYYIKQLAGEPDYSENEAAVRTWTGAKRATERSYTLRGSDVQPNVWYKFVVRAEAEGYDSSWSRYTYIKVPDREDWIHMVMPAAISSIDEEAFAGNELLRTLDASNSNLAVIRSRAFANCVNLQSINLPLNVEEIADDAFYNCPALTIHCVSDSYAEEYADRMGIPKEVHGVAIDADVLRLSQPEWNIPTADAASTVVRVTSSGAWSASSDASWLTLDRGSGDDGANVVLSASKNASNALRSGKVHFTCGSAAADLTVIQNASATRNCGLKLSIDSWTPTSDALTRDIFVESDGGFTVRSDKSWLTYSIQDGTVRAEVDASALSTSQTGILTITCSECGASKTVTVSSRGDAVPIPTGLKVATVDPEALSVSWNAVTGASYFVERSKSASDGWTRIRTLGAGETSFMDSGLESGVTYYYRVYARKTISGRLVDSAASAVSSGRTAAQTTFHYTGAFGGILEGGYAALQDLGTLSWTKLADAEYYKVALRNTKTDKIVSGWNNTDVGNVGSVSLEGKLSEGVSYRVWVGAYNRYDHLIGQAPALNFTVRSNILVPTIVINSVTPSAVSNSGKSYFSISFTAENAKSFAFNFDGIQVWEMWAKNEASDRIGPSSRWVFDESDIGNAFSDSKTTWTAKFYPVNEPAPGKYNVTVQAIADDGKTSAAQSTQIEIKEKDLFEPRSITKVYNQKDYDDIVKYWMPSDCPKYPDVSKRDPNSGRTLKSSGCGVFTIAHAIQWLTGENPDIATVRDHCGNTANYNEGMKVSAMDYIENEYGIKHEEAGATTQYLKGIFDKNGVIVAATPGNGDHYFLAVEYMEYGSGTYVHIIDSSTGSTLTRGYQAYWIDTMEPIKNYREICTSGWFGEGHEYWISMADLRRKVLLALTYDGPSQPQGGALTKQSAMANLRANGGYFGDKTNMCLEVMETLWDSEYSPAYIAGVLASASAEGNFGLFENVMGYTQEKMVQVFNAKKISEGGKSHQNYVAHMKGFTDYDGCGHDHSEYAQYNSKYIYNGFSLKTIDSMLQRYKAEGWQARFGLGVIQWTADRTVSLMKFYHEEAGDADTITRDQCRAAEMKHMASELQSGYYGIFSSWNKNYGTEANAAYCAGVMITQQYVRPAGSNTAGVGAVMRPEGSMDKARGEKAQQIYDIMIGK